MPEKVRETRFIDSLRFRYGLGLVAFLAVAGFFLWEEHEAHILGYLPLILIFGGCLVMHLFMHGGHGSQSGHNGKNEDRD